MKCTLDLTPVALAVALCRTVNRSPTLFGTVPDLSNEGNKTC